MAHLNAEVSGGILRYVKVGWIVPADIPEDEIWICTPLPNSVPVIKLKGVASVMWYLLNEQQRMRRHQRRVRVQRKRRMARGRERTS